MTGQQKDALMDQRAAAMGDDAGRKPGVVRLNEEDERPDIRKEIQNVDDLHRGQAVGDASTRATWAFRAKSPGRLTSGKATSWWWTACVSGGLTCCEQSPGLDSCSFPHGRPRRAARRITRPSLMGHFR